jgi:predicted transcriptional regulator
LLEWNEMGEVYRNSVKIGGDMLRIADKFGVSGVNLPLLLRKANLSYGRLSSTASKLMQTGPIDE